MNNRDRLIELLADHELERREVAELLKVKTDTVNHWLISHESHHYEDMPDMAIELLEIKLGAKKP
jgi:orotate phosphoribosyltransferase-like protein